MFQINYVERNQKKISVKNALSPNFVIVQKNYKVSEFATQEIQSTRKMQLHSDFFPWALFFISEKQRVQIFYTNMPKNTILKKFSTMDKAEIEDILEISRKEHMDQKIGKNNYSILVQKKLNDT